MPDIGSTWLGAGCWVGYQLVGLGRAGLGRESTHGCLPVMLGCLTLCLVAGSESQWSNNGRCVQVAQLARASSKVALAGSESSSSSLSLLQKTSGVAQGGKLRLHIRPAHSWVLTFPRPQGEVYSGRDYNNTSRAGRTGQTYLPLFLCLWGICTQNKPFCST